MIKNSLEWTQVEANLLRRGRKISHRTEFRKLLNNIHTEVAVLSQFEVEHRCHRKYSVDDVLKKINDDIELLEEYMIIAILTS